MLQPTLKHSIKKVSNNTQISEEDTLAIEEPLEIKMLYYNAGIATEKSISVTMRTPGNDAELATGFLYTEGIITDILHVKSAAHVPYCDDNIIKITLQETVNPEVAKLERHFYTTSSCGVCGKSSIDAIRTLTDTHKQKDNILFELSTIYKLTQKLRDSQEVFEQTGGLHASALFDISGNLLLVREDVGRHNALDKLIGAALEKGMLPLNDHLLLLSGRASFELIQKAAMAGIKMVAAVGAPSSLAVQLAAEMDMTLIGFLRGERFNIYTGEKRVKL